MTQTSKSAGSVPAVNTSKPRFSGPGALADLAESYQARGIREVLGPASNPLIKSWIEECERLHPTDLPIDDSKYAWCGVFVGHCCLELGLGAPAYFQGAKNWLKWGVEVKFSAVQRGDVMVKKRDGGNHVAVVARVDKLGVWVCGGNQSNSVSTVFYPFSAITGFRRHKSNVQ